MQKSYLFTIATILIAAATIPVLCMDSPLTDTEIPTITVTLDLYEVTQKYIKSNKFFDKDDKNNCSILGIPWEESNNKYFTRKALFKHPKKKYDICWKNWHPKELPASTKTEGYFFEATERKIRFPLSLPGGFVERLKEENFIILENGSFEHPVKIILQTGNIEDLAPSNTKTYMLLLGGLGISIAGLMSYLIYLYHNNQLNSQFSSITHFMSNLKNK